MKNIFRIAGVILLVIFISSCKKDKPLPVITPGPIIFNPDLTYGTLTDIEGNVYKTIAIGSQVWMAENLITTKYSNGDLIGTTTPLTLDTHIESTPRYQWPNWTEKNVPLYGKLYTWYTATDTRNLCPTGWHIPNEAEWTTLTDFLGGQSVAGGRLKETGTTHWMAPNKGSTNVSGFTALPGGDRSPAGVFGNIQLSGSWWSFSSGPLGEVYTLDLDYNLSSGIISNTHGKNAGYSVRCLQND